MEVNMTKSVSWCPCMGAKCRGNNPPFCSIKTSNCKSVQTERLKQALQKAEAVIIGVGAGLSTSAGFTYSGERFEKWFGDFRQVHGFSDMYSGGFFPYKTLEEYWAYWSRYIYMQHATWPDAVYACINKKEACAPEEIRKKSICVEADIGAVLEKLYDRKNSQGDVAVPEEIPQL